MTDPQIQIFFGLKDPEVKFTMSESSWEIFKRLWPVDPVFVPISKRDQRLRVNAVVATSYPPYKTYEQRLTVSVFRYWFNIEHGLPAADLNFSHRAPHRGPGAPHPLVKFSFEPDEDPTQFLKDLFGFLRAASIGGTAMLVIKKVP